MRLSRDRGEETTPIDERIVVDPNICSGKPTIRGTQMMVKNILGMVAGGYIREQILKAYPELAPDDVAAALEYASLSLTH